jgi:hypothetical protein
MYNFRSIAVATALGLGAGALIGALPLTESATAAPIAAPAEGKVDSGAIKSVDAANNRFVVTIRDRDVTFRVSDDTKYTLDGEESTMGEALKVGGTASITHEDYLASKVDVTSSKPE